MARDRHGLPETNPSVVPLLRIAAELFDDAAKPRADGDKKEYRASIRQMVGVLQRCGLPLPPERVGRFVAVHA